MTDIVLSFGIPLAYFALAVATLAAIMFPLAYMFQDLKKAMSAFIGIGILVVLFIVCYLLTGDGDFSVGDIQVAEGQMKLVEAGLYLFYITLAGSVLAIVYSSVSRYFK